MTPKISGVTFVIQVTGNKQGWSNQSLLQWLGLGSARMLVSGPTQQPGKNQPKWATATKPWNDIPLNPDWLIGILIMAYETIPI